MLQKTLLRLLAAGALPRPLAQRVRQRAWTIEAGEAAGLKLKFPQNRDFIIGTSELPVQRCIADRLPPGGVFYDIGANIGFFSLLAARRVAPNGRVYAFEPVPANVATIKANAALNGISSISVTEVALADRTGSAVLHVTDWDGGATLDPTLTSRPTAGRQVRVARLDELVKSENLPPPTVVKIDVEGAEMSVIAGMQETLVQFKPVLIYEIDDGEAEALAHRWDRLDEMIRGFGYHVTRLPASYPNVAWHVGHGVASPIPRHS